MIRLTITPAAYAVIVATQPASVGFEPNKAPNGEFYVWLDPRYVDRLRAMRKPGESYSDVILRLAEASRGA
jgi:hypothetical protein